MAAAAHTWRDEIRDQVRGFAGGMLFGVPLLFTMEVWWVGGHSSPRQLAGVLSLTFAVVLVLDRIAGFRDDRPRTVLDALGDSVEAVAMGIVVSTIVLMTIQEITLATPLAEALGKIVYHATTASVGVALAAQFFHGAADSGGDDSGPASDSELVGTVVDLGAAATGAMFVASAIAPTDEIPMLAAVATPGWLLTVMAISLFVSYCVVFVSGFGNEAQRHAQRGVLQHPVTETIAAYLVALAAGVVMLVLFQRVDLGEPWYVWTPSVVLLGFPAAVGGAAGRLAV